MPKDSSQDPPPPKKTAGQNPARNKRLASGHPYNTRAKSSPTTRSSGSNAVTRDDQEEPRTTATQRTQRTLMVKKKKQGAVAAQTLLSVTAIERAGNVFSGNNYGVITQTVEESNVLRTLPTHPDVGIHLSECFPNSRAEDEARILEWILSDPSFGAFLCVLGKVGVGKSTLARHLANRLRQDNCLAAEMYFGFALPEWTVEYVFRMMAGQLCAGYPALAHAVHEATRMDVGPTVPLEIRVEKLLLQPIRSLGLQHPLVVVLDAPDQWPPHTKLFEVLGSCSISPSLVRFVVLGRQGLESCFRAAPAKCYILHPVSKDVMANYFADKFAHVRWTFSRKPSANVVTQLVDRANGLFIWSSTLCSLLQQKLRYPDPHATIDAILQSRDGIGDSTILANLYYVAIDARFPTDHDKAVLKKYLGAVLALQEPLPINVFASLTSMHIITVEDVQDNLAAFVTGRSNVTNRMIYPASLVFHQSFLEFLESTGKPSHTTFSVDVYSSHSQLAKACLEGLHRMTLPVRPNFVSPLHDYIVRYWPMHTSRGTPSVTPTSDNAWKATPHHVLLSKLSQAQWRNWATAYVTPLRPELDIDLSDTESTEMAKLEGSNATHRRDLLISRLAYSMTLDETTAGTPGTIAIAEVAVRLQCSNALTWLDLERAHSAAAKTRSSLEFIESAVKAARYALELDSHGDFCTRQVLAACLYDRYNRQGSQQDLYASLQLERDVLSSTPAGHPDRADSLNNLASSLDSHFRQTGEVESLEEARSLYREALSLRPPGHPNRAHSLNNLAISLESHFRQTGMKESLAEAMALYREALSLRPPGHPDRADSLNDLASSLHSHFSQTGMQESLEEALALGREALALRLPGHPGRAHPLNSLAISLESHFRQTGMKESLAEAMALYREALSLRPPGHPDRADSLNDLASSLHSHFSQTGMQESLEEALALGREALSLRPPGNPDRADSLNNLAISLESHFRQTGMTASLEEANTLRKEALSLRKSSHVQ